MLFEFGEHVKDALDTIGLTEERMKSWFFCWCDARRAWLNDVGEQLWELIDPAALLRCRRRFSQIVTTALDGHVLSESSICTVVSLNLPGLSPYTTKRWLTKMVRAGVLSEMQQGGERWVSLR